MPGIGCGRSGQMGKKYKTKQKSTNQTTHDENDDATTTIG